MSRPSSTAVPIRLKPVPLVVVLGIVFSVLLTWWLDRSEHRRILQEFRGHAEVRHTLILQTLRTYEQGLYGLRSRFAGAAEVSPDDFRAAAAELIQRNPGIQAYQWVQRVTASERPSIEAEGRRRMPDFAFRDHVGSGRFMPAAAKEEHLVILYCEPVAGNEVVFGYDITTAPTYPTLQRADALDDLVLSLTFPLAQRPDRRGGFVMTMPVREPAGERAGPRQLRGFVQGVFIADELLARAWTDRSSEVEEVLITEPVSTGGENVIYQHTARETPPLTPDDFASRWALTLPLRFGHREWTVHYRPHPGWVTAQHSIAPLVALAGSLLLTGLAAGLTRSMSRRSELVRAEVELRTAELSESRRQLDSLFSQLPGMAYRCRGDERLTPVYVSSGCLALTGYTSDDFTAKRFDYASLIDPADAGSSTQIMHTSLRQHRTFEVEYRIRHKNGETRWVLDRGIGIYAATGQLAFVEGLAIDVTDRRRAEQGKLDLERKLLEGQKLESIGVLAGGIAHDFNNLLTSILGHASLASIARAHDAPLLLHLQAIEGASQRAAELCQQMLAYAGKGRFVVGPVDLGRLVRETLPLLRISLGKNVVLTLDLAAQLPAVEADATQMRQILMNLVINASDAIGGRGGEIAVSTSSGPADPGLLARAHQGEISPGTACVMLQVRDTGSGMDAETLARIFEPFFTTKFAGRGLGLAAVLGFVRSHRGVLAVESEPGRGTQFSLLLPASKASPGLDTEPAPDLVPLLPPGRVLVVDDEESVRTTVGQIIEKLGYPVDLAASGDEALAFQSNGPHVLVLLDLTMPGRDGFDTLHALRSVNAELPVVIMSGFSESEVSPRIVSLRRVTFVQKPFTAERLLERIMRVLS